MKKLLIAAASAALSLPVLAQDAPLTGVSFIEGAQAEISSYNTPIVTLLTTCFAIVMIFVGYKLAKRSVSKA